MNKQQKIFTRLLISGLLLCIPIAKGNSSATSQPEERRSFSSPIVQAAYDYDYPGRGNGNPVNVTKAVEKYIPLGTDLADVKTIVDKNLLTMSKLIDILPADTVKAHAITDRSYRITYLFKGANLFSGDWSTTSLVIALTFSEQNKLIKIYASIFHDGF